MLIDAVHGRKTIEPLGKGIQEAGDSKPIVARIPLLRKIVLISHVYSVCLLVPVASIWIMASVAGLGFIDPRVLTILAQVSFLRSSLSHSLSLSLSRPHL